MEEGPAFSAREILDGGSKTLNIAVFVQNDFATFAAVAASLALQLARAAHSVTWVRLDHLSSTLNSHVRFGRSRGWQRPRKPLDQLSQQLIANSTVSVVNRSASRKQILGGLPVVRGASVRLADIEPLSVSGLPIGEAIWDAVVRRTGEVDGNLRVPHAFVQNLASNYQVVHDAVYRFSKAESLDLAIIFNGRFLPESAAVQALKQNGIQTVFYESGGALQTADLYSHETHDLVSLSNRAASLLASSDNYQTLQRLSEDWIVPRINLETPEIRSFGVSAASTSEYISLPTNSVVYFSSSSDELEFSEKGTASKQRSDVKLVADVCRTLGVPLVVRTHPNMRNKSPRIQQEWEQHLSEVNPHLVISQKSDVAAAQVLSAASAAVTSYSTVAVEGIYLNKPTLVMRETDFSTIQGIHRGWDRTSVEAFLQELPQPDARVATAYGAFRMIRGFTLKDVTVGTHDQPTFRGKTLNSRRSAAGILARTEWRIRDKVIKRSMQ